MGFYSTVYLSLYLSITYRVFALRIVPVGLGSEYVSAALESIEYLCYRNYYGRSCTAVIKIGFEIFFSAFSFTSGYAFSVSI